MKNAGVRAARARIKWVKGIPFWLKHSQTVAANPAFLSRAAGTAVHHHYYLFIILFSFYSIYWNAKAAKGVNASLAAVLLMRKRDYFTSGQFFASLARSAMGRPNRLIKPFASN